MMAPDSTEGDALMGLILSPRAHEKAPTRLKMSIVKFLRILDNPRYHIVIETRRKSKKRRRVERNEFGKSNGEVTARLFYGTEEQCWYVAFIDTWNEEIFNFTSVLRYDDAGKISVRTLQRAFIQAKRADQELGW
jgi:hypothetical protein